LRATRLTLPSVRARSFLSTSTRSRVALTTEEERCAYMKRWSAGSKKFRTGLVQMVTSSGEESARVSPMERMATAGASPIPISPSTPTATAISCDGANLSQHRPTQTERFVMSKETSAA